MNCQETWLRGLAFFSCKGFALCASKGLFGMRSLEAHGLEIFRITKLEQQAPSCL